MRKWFLIAAILVSWDGFSQVITAEEKRHTVEKLSHLLSKHYVLVDTARMMINKIQTNLREGAYDSISSYEAYAKALNDDLRSVYFDQHMGVYYKRTSGSKRQELFRSIMQKKQYESKILEGNVGYFDINTFLFHDPKGRRIVNGALEQFKNIDALIIDVRDNFGGNANIPIYLAGQFLYEGTHMSTVHRRDGNGLKPFRRNISKSKFAQFQKTDLPVYVLINEKTASAGESVAYLLQSFKRAVVVGQISAGAAHANIKKPINKSFAMLMPYEKSINPVTGKDYEFTGVIPDVLVDSERALDKSLSLIRNAQ